MKWLKLPDDLGKPAWGGLFWAVPMAYIFWAPYARGANWVEWTLTALAFAIFLVLYTIGLVYWSRKQVVLRVCIGLAALAVVFTALRTSGVIFFVLVAAFAPFAVGGNIARSAAIIVAVVLVLQVEWWLRWPPDDFPHFFSIQSLLIGAGTTFVARQQIALVRSHRVDERERIARDLHDILGQTLSVITLKSELAGRLMEQNPQAARIEIGDIERISRQALSEVRQAISGYRTGGLDMELERARSVLETAGIIAECHHEPMTMPPAHERVLALVLREAVTNVARHAHATRCRLTLQKTCDGYQLKVNDDGRGGAHQEGWGMRGIRERVAAIGGEASWRSESGTELTITVPVATKGAVESGQ